MGPKPAQNIVPLGIKRMMGKVRHGDPTAPSYSPMLLEGGIPLGDCEEAQDFEEDGRHDERQEESESHHSESFLRIYPSLSQDETHLHRTD
eukprot:g15013.t1